MHELAGSLSTLCRHKDKEPHQDGIVWVNRMKPPRNLVLEFDIWPFKAPRETTIVVAPDSMSRTYTLNDKLGGWRFIKYKCLSCTQRGDVVPGINLPQPGPAVVVDD